MAANPFDNVFPSPNLFDIYNDPTVINRNVLPVWPGGSCNFVDLTTGAGGARCGCRRFWARPLPGTPTPDSAGWCMCNHHACFHDEGSRDAQAPETRAPIAGQENEPPPTGREPLSPVVDLVQNPASTDFGLDYANLGPSDTLSFIYYDPDALGLERRAPPAPTQQPSGTIPDTLDWNQHVHTNPQPSSLPPPTTPRQLLSQTTSTTSSNFRNLRPFAGKGLNTLGRPGAPVAQSQLQYYSPEQATSIRTQTPNAQGISQTANPRHGVMAEAYRPSTATQADPRAVQEEGLTREALQNITDTIGGHEQRLDRLETVSFSAGAHEECMEKHDHADLRVTDLEARMDDMEKQAVRFSDRTDDAASQSVASFSTATTSRPTHSQELYSQLQSLQAQVNSLQSILPSPSHGWEIEVVFLPFALKKVWQELHHFKADNTQGNNEWTQLHLAHNTDQRISQSPLQESWSGSVRDARWLMPRACGEKGAIDKRLRSRGLIRTISVNSPDARSVQNAMHAAFGPVWRYMRMNPASQMAGLESTNFMGLLSQWVPLRKIHKDSRLRFLSAAEMVTPATWDVQFLSSVMMRSSEPRLFVTHPDAYMQDDQAYEAAWSWKRLHDLPPFRSDTGTLDNNSEQHWTFQAQLDDTDITPPTDVSRHNKSLTSITSSSPRLFATSDANRSISPAISATGQLHRPNGRRASRPPHIRTASMPVAAQTQQSPALSRRVVSSGQSRRSSPIVRVASQHAVTKRRHTRSPGLNFFTPRRSTSASPMPMAIDRQSAQPTTPFGYHTPFSNVAQQEFPRTRGNSAAPMPMDEDIDDDGAHADELYDVEFYEDSSSGDSDGDDSESSTSAEVVTHAQAGVSHDSQQYEFPEDEPWPGIEDLHRMSDGENVDPHEADRHSNASSQPSEYPSTQRAWPRAENGVGFQIHEDDD